VRSWFQNGTGDLGTTIKAASAAFQEARAAVRAFGVAVLFIDEIDSLPNRALLDADRGSWWIPVVNHVLMLLDGASSNLVGVVLLGATNNVGALDPALLRPGRFGGQIAMRTPDADDLAGIVRHHLGGESCPVTLGELAALVKPLTGATPAQAADWAAGARARARDAGRPVTLGDVAATAFPPDRRSAENLARTALHEAGHVVASLRLIPGRLVSVSLVETEWSAGNTHYQPSDDTALTKAEIEAQVVVLLAGRAADVVVGGGATAGAGGHDSLSDLGQATVKLTMLHGAWGMGDTLRHRPSRTFPTWSVTEPALGAQVEADLQRLMRLAEALVAEEAVGVRAVAEALRSPLPHCRRGPGDRGGLMRIPTRLRRTRQLAEGSRRRRPPIRPNDMSRREHRRAGPRKQARRRAPGRSDLTEVTRRASSVDASQRRSPGLDRGRTRAFHCSLRRVGGGQSTIYSALFDAVPRRPGRPRTAATPPHSGGTPAERRS